MTLQHPEFFDLPDRRLGVATHDVHRLTNGSASGTPSP